MRVVGLISGGKDSIWNLHYCQHFGHEVVCLAHLAPPEGKNELDSFMYQTVGSNVIGFIAQALGLPVVQRVISGCPKETTSNTYVPREGDEVEDLLLLLRDVLESHPGVEAVSCGAILSNYQRLRVENVCARLGLKVLAFMWRQEQERLLKQMIAARLDARIAKVASMGLSAKHVGRSILDEAFARYVFELGAKWGVHVCGEGGEYETTVADAPLYKSAIRVISSETLAHEDGEGDDVFFLRVQEMDLEPKGDSSSELLHTSVLDVYSSLVYYQQTFPALLPSGQSEARASSSSSICLVGDAAPCQRVDAALVRVGSVLASSSLDAAVCGVDLDGTPTEQCHAVFSAVSAWLKSEHGLGLGDALFVELQVRDLSQFEAVNAVYAKFFDVDPPPRVCIQTPLPAGLHLRLRLLLRLGLDAGLGPSEGHHAPPANDDSGLRVQSISTWAMACIGPYSQAKWVGSALLLSAGVLGLVPHSMSFPAPKMAAAAWASAPQAEEGCSDAEDAEDCERAADGGQGAALAAEIAAAPPEQWEAELWLLMRSLRNVLVVMGSDFARVGWANILVSPGCDCDEVQRRVQAYMLRDVTSPAASSPLLTCSAVPRLPKDGKVEVNVLCHAPSSGSSDPLAPAEQTVLRSGPVTGSVSVSTRALTDDITLCAVDLVVDAECPGSSDTLSRDLPCESLAALVKGCTEALLQSKGGKVRALLMAKGSSLQVQYALQSDASHAAVTSSVSEAIQGAGLRDLCAVSFMPVDALSHGACMRFIAMVSG